MQPPQPPPYQQPMYYPPPYQQPPPYGYYRPFRPGLVARVNRPVRVLIGIGTFLPLVAFGAYFIFIFGFVFRSIAATSPYPAQPTPFPTEFFAGFGIVFLLFFVSIIAYYALFILFVIDVFKNDRIIEDVKIIWMFALFFGSIISLPIYWFMYFRTAPASLPSPPPTFAPPPAPPSQGQSLQ